MNLSRNIGILSEEEQKKISQTKIAILGVGMGSVVAEIAVRTGFTDLLLVDGDTVSDTNLNRQLYVESDIGVKKIAALRKRLDQINPTLNIKYVEEFLTSESIPELLGDREIVIDTIDLSAFDVIKEVHGYARTNNIPVVFPINLGWKSMVTVFDKESATMESLIGIESEDGTNMKMGNFETWARFLASFVPEYGLGRFQEFISKAENMDDWCPAPQIGATIYTTSSLVIATAVKISLGHKTLRSPEIAEIDLYDFAAGH